MAAPRSVTLWRCDFRSMASSRCCNGSRIGSGTTVISGGAGLHITPRVGRKLAAFHALDGPGLEPALRGAVEEVAAALELDEVRCAGDPDEKLVLGAEPAPGFQPLRIVVELADQHEGRRADAREIRAPAEIRAVG